MQRILYISLLIILSLKSVAQHRPLYSQYMFNPIVLNPGYTGSNDALTAVVHARKQMAKFPGTPFTQTATIHSPVGNKKANLGLMLSHDQFGLTNQTEILTNFAYRIKITEKGRLA